MDPRRKFGNLCEAAAARFLEDKGYKILARQFYTRVGEIDLVAEIGEELVFVEVKARRNIKFGFPEEAVGRGKIKKMLAAADIYMSQNKIFERPFRLDIIAILGLKNQEFQIVHLEGIDIGDQEC
ncbi:MAG: hypothetical protein UX09_C0031G0004 [Candidatus Uhrbacteria bacterium GW2011_GWE2_45_35]|uniref:UPF0102 protein UW63_C0041G0004 n=2 Tax=Candidatus Uhriibacteriota TaxID=1752732 RepID=A0A0G1JE76_9BACT|nr:MAG: hypothetical protein UW63_C0041G0004 [Candidatus Uhrbacteria bacterium GW2011_GWF2_44_350]KKU07308.1 MAG: hypothetical protein UX09_C0031G0004 [Candidatus Uhrbacteria bacterium GW2011_GWE2_45_35]HBR80810.1 YraN family protein [Candidatus Uhrbacteria bacterium]HCU31381.1 YraN family protein [Candidatus Uhrbacteria bacterium]